MKPFLELVASIDSLLSKREKTYPVRDDVYRDLNIALDELVEYLLESSGGPPFSKSTTKYYRKSPGYGRTQFLSVGLERRVLRYLASFWTGTRICSSCPATPNTSIC